MIDLYRRLGARGPSDTAQIERAMANPALDPELRRLAAFILGDPVRRQVHDDAWRTVSVAARIRSALLLEMTKLWQTSNVGDFGPSVVDAARLPECLPVDRGAPEADR
jgi:hypothetical protein